MWVNRVGQFLLLLLNLMYECFVRFMNAQMPRGWPE